MKFSHLALQYLLQRDQVIKIGPAVTQYEIQPAQGVKVSKIVNLHNDIALALATILLTLTP
jgi:DNA segregation ATPase FtsK/SpoIIIE-like protein